jgi:hypothetical protein
VFYWIYDISTERLAVLMTVVFVGFSWLGAIVIRPILRIFVRSSAGTNDVVGYVLSCFCVFYGLLLGLIAVAAYQDPSQVESFPGWKCDWTKGGVTKGPAVKIGPE